MDMLCCHVGNRRHVRIVRPAPRLHGLEADTPKAHLVGSRGGPAPDSDVVLHIEQAELFQNSGRLGYMDLYAVVFWEDAASATTDSDGSGGEFDSCGARMGTSCVGRTVTRRLCTRVAAWDHKFPRQGYSSSSSSSSSTASTSTSPVKEKPESAARARFNALRNVLARSSTRRGSSAAPGGYSGPSRDDGDVACQAGRAAADAPKGLCSRLASGRPVGASRSVSPRPLSPERTGEAEAQRVLDARADSFVIEVMQEGYMGLGQPTLCGRTCVTVPKLLGPVALRCGGTGPQRRVPLWLPGQDDAVGCIVLQGEMFPHEAAESSSRSSAHRLLPSAATSSCRNSANGGTRNGLAYTSGSQRGRQGVRRRLRSPSSSSGSEVEASVMRKSSEEFGSQDSGWSTSGMVFKKKQEASPRRGNSMVRTTSEEGSTTGPCSLRSQESPGYASSASGAESDSHPSQTASRHERKPPSAAAAAATASGGSSSWTRGGTSSFWATLEERLTRLRVNIKKYPKGGRGLFSVAKTRFVAVEVFEQWRGAGASSRSVSCARLSWYTDEASWRTGSSPLETLLFPKIQAVSYEATSTTSASPISRKTSASPVVKIFHNEDEAHVEEHVQCLEFIFEEHDVAKEWAADFEHLIADVRRL
eukprot:TRINITY_DN16866_c0_g3_i2.p1 TRINITY_DN16866_c0_g3~~TRINITY_DN16866_c0_g3_i2.p1  ORF type:complete len:645 (-),score=102.83 TRINITY_DN16866_c0_g3_i2:189-2123(-)